MKEWKPRRVLVTPAALGFAHGRRIAERCEVLGLDVVELPSNRITGLRGETERETSMNAKSTGSSTSLGAAPRTASTSTWPGRCPARQ